MQRHKTLCPTCFSLPLPTSRSFHRLPPSLPLASSFTIPLCLSFSCPPSLSPTRHKANPVQDNDLQRSPLTVAACSPYSQRLRTGSWCPSPFWTTPRRTRYNTNLTAVNPFQALSLAYFVETSPRPQERSAGQPVLTYFRFTLYPTSSFLSLSLPPLPHFSFLSILQLSPLPHVYPLASSLFIPFFLYPFCPASLPISLSLSLPLSHTHTHARTRATDQSCSKTMTNGEVPYSLQAAASADRDQEGQTHSGHVRAGLHPEGHAGI